MGKMYEDWNKLFCDQMVEEIKKFEKCPTKEQLCVIKDLIEVTNGLQEMEMDGAIRRIAEDRYGYDSGTGRFRKDGMEQFGRDAEMEFIEMFNAARGRGRGRRRDSRGRFIGNMADPRYMPPYYPDMDDDGYHWARPYYMMNDGKREYSADRFERKDDEDDERIMNAGRGGNRGGSNGNGRGGNRGNGRSSGGSSDGRGGRSGGSYNAYPYGDDDEMYMLRQENGMPIMTPYNAHDPKEIPKKLTKQQYEEWASDLFNADGSSGPHFSKEQAKQAQQKVGLTSIPEEAWFTALNATYSDTCEFFAKRDMNNIDTYAEFAKLFWFEDDDAVGGNEDEPNTQKLAAYYTAVVEH